MTYVFKFQVRYTGTGAVGETLKTPGVDFGKPLEIVYRPPSPKPRVANYMLVRGRGHVAWSGVGSTSYYKTCYMLIKVYQYHCPAKSSLTGEAFDTLMAEEILREEAGRKWKDCVRKLSVRCNELQLGEDTL